MKTKLLHVSFITASLLLSISTSYAIDKPFEFHKLVVDGQPIIPFPKEDMSKSLGGDKDDIKAMTDGIGLFIDRPDFTKATNQSISINSSFFQSVMDKFKKPAEAENLSVEDYINNHWDELDDSTKAWLLSGLVEKPLIKQEDLSNPPYFTTIPPINYVLGDPNRGSYVLPLSWFPVKDDDSDISFTLKNEYNSEFGSLYNGDTKLVPGSSFKYSDIENGLIKFVPNYGTIDSNPSKTSSVGNIGTISESSFGNGYLTDPYIDGNYKAEFNFTSGKYMGSFSNELAPIIAPSNKCSVTAGECNYMEQLGYSGVQYLLDFNSDPKKCTKVWLPDSTNSSDGYSKSYTIETSKDVYGYSLSNTICRSIDVYSNNDTILAREVQFYPQGSLPGSSYITPDSRTYIVTSLPADGTLYNNSTPLNVGDSFSDEDLKNGTIYSIANDGSSGVKDLTFGYNVEGNSKSSNSPISISQSSFSGIINNIDNDVPPIVTSSTPFNIDGGPVIVTNSMMGVTDPNGDSFTYNVTDSGNGSFKDSSGNVVTSFTNSDLDNNSIQYVPNEGSTSSTIVFNVNDSNGNSVINSRSVTLNYLSSPAAPTITTSNNIFKFVDNDILLNSNNISSSDINGDSFVYKVTQLPPISSINKKGTPLNIGDTFTQNDIDSGLISYNLVNSDIETLEEFKFTAIDNKGYESGESTLYFQNMGDLVFPGNGKHAGNTGIGHIEGSDWVVSKGETGTNSRGFALHSYEIWPYSKGSIFYQYSNGLAKVKFKIKVSDNSGHNKIGFLSCTEKIDGTWKGIDSKDIYTDDFAQSDTYQDFVLYCDWTPNSVNANTYQFFGMDGIDSSFTDIYVNKVSIEKPETETYYTSCNDILQNGASNGDGIYTIDPDGINNGVEPFDVYCDMTTDGGGWTLVMKGDSNAFPYEDIAWTSNNIVNTINDTNYKSQGFNSLPLKQIRISFNNDTDRWFMNYSANSMRDIFNSSSNNILLSKSDGGDKNDWLNIIPDSKLQIGTYRVGFNLWNDSDDTHESKPRLRLGILANNESDMVTPDSWTGIGYNSNSPFNNGNFARYNSSGGGDSDIPSSFKIWVRDTKETIYRTSCLDILDHNESIGDGWYYIDPDGLDGNAPYQAYCDMTDGGWTRISQFKYPDGTPVENACSGDGWYNDGSIKTCKYFEYNQSYNTWSFDIDDDSKEYKITIDIINNTGSPCNDQLTDHLNVDGNEFDMTRTTTWSTHSVRFFFSSGSHSLTFNADNGNYKSGECDDNPLFKNIYLYEREF